MKYTFDKQVERRSYGSVKWNHFGADVLPLWVADMDFQSPPAVRKALQQQVDFGVCGYTLPPPELGAVVQARIKRLYGADIEQDWLVWLPGVVPGFNLAVRALGAAGDEVVTFSPAYPPFFSAAEHHGMHTVRVPLTDELLIDFDELQAALTPRTRMLLLCSPQNPGGRIWRRAELERLTQLCLANNVLLISDEIHCDLLLDREKQHIPTFTLSESVAQNTITLMAPSKTFNVAGLNLAYAIISNRRLRTQFRRAMEGICPYPNMMGYAAALAAYRDGGEWLVELLDYLRANLEHVFEHINAMPGLSMARCEATYLAWIDARELPVANPHTLFLEHGVGLSDGAEFGRPGFLRLNFACPRVTLDDVLVRMAAAIDSVAGGAQIT